jgi:hypothetical protein
MSVVVATPAQMSRDEALAATDEVRHDFGVLWNKVLDLYERGAHIALNYSSWGEYWSTEFGVSGARGEQLVRAGRVARELERAGLPLPANDLTARQLLPVLRSAPDELAPLWQRALDQHGKPNARQVQAMVAPYRQTRDSTGADEAQTRRSQTKRARNVVTHSLDAARTAAEAASAGLEAALATEPTDKLRDEWAHDARHCAQLFAELARSLHREGSP